MEIWKEVEGFPNYKVSNLGRVKSKHKNYIKATRIKNSGYEMTDLYNNGKQKTVMIHRLVAKNFIPNLEGKETVNHKDGNKLNNRVDNLEWMTFSEQNKHFYASGLKSEKNIKKAVKAMNEANYKKIRCINDGIIYISISEAARKTGVSTSQICSYLKGKGNSAGKDSNGNPLYWEYV